MITVATGGNNFAKWLNDGDKVPYITRKWGKGYRDIYDWLTLNEEGVRIKSGKNFPIIPYNQIVSYTLS